MHYIAEFLAPSFQLDTERRNPAKQSNPPHAGQRGAGPGFPIRAATLSRNSLGVDIPATSNHRNVFERLFPPADRDQLREAQNRLELNRSILDTAGESVREFQRPLGAADRRRLEQDLESIREVERRLNDSVRILQRGRPRFNEAAVRVQPEARNSMREHIELMFDLIVLAFQTDMTRVVTHSLGGEEERLDGMTVAVAGFFGVRMECAKCHDHPYVDEWKHHHYYGLASFLTRTELSIINAKPTLRERDTGEVMFQNRKRESFKAELRFLDDKVFAEPKRARTANKGPTDLPAIAEFSPRKALADYAFVPSNPYFKRPLVNRLWKELMGVGLAEPVDQIHNGNKPSHPKAFEALSEDFASNGFDLKRLIANIMETEAYRRGSVWPGKERPKESQYAVFNLRPLTPEQLAMSLATATRLLRGGQAAKEEDGCEGVACRVGERLQVIHRALPTSWARTTGRSGQSERAWATGQPQRTIAKGTQWQ